MKSKQITQLTLYNIMFWQTSPPVPAFSETVRVNHFDAQSCSDILGLCIYYLDPDNKVRTAAEPRIVHGPKTFDPAYRYNNRLKRSFMLVITGGSYRSFNHTDFRFNLFYCLKCAVTTGYPIVERTEVAILQFGAKFEKSKRHQLFYLQPHAGISFLPIQVSVKAHKSNNFCTKPSLDQMSPDIFSAKAPLKKPQKILAIVILLRRGLAPPIQIIKGIGADDKAQLGGPREPDTFKMAKAASEELQNVLAIRDWRYGD
ncbi:hypothetical protein PpBr36_02288 [Pyricularia pennisetigena]|uniref:hypothetical protein n=1 Tax=Pyricularia pennisetigena TaxID=1578925 RepID=UPI0011503718|nr:hypothetical protein PpBr36_02288 [Pyricularia pennisetigena]TLS30179.1 hypothetical protein PpBr36_02288 [Pyricularia pennisetigena]